jgi:protein-L-isoaspartate(D-aspartate) O-methyltransferase
LNAGPLGRRTLAWHPYELEKKEPGVESPESREADFDDAREKMVRRDLAARGITDERVLGAFRRVRRERFVWDVDARDAYADHPLRIGEGQTISQPYMVALMTEALMLPSGPRCSKALRSLGPQPSKALRSRAAKRSESGAVSKSAAVTSGASASDAALTKVLEIGTGSGYQTAILAELAREVCTVERIAALSEKARATLAGQGYGNIRYRVGDGTLGWPEEAPFDRVIVTAGAPRVPESLKLQLAEGGRLVIPVGGGHGQDLLIVTREGEDFRTEKGTGCIFVKLIGEEGWPA